MRTAFKFAVAFLALSFAASAPAGADDVDRYYDGEYLSDFDQGWWYDESRDELLTSGQIIYLARLAGYHRIRAVSYQRYAQMYRVIARDWRGNYIRLFMDPYTGRIVDRARLDVHRYNRDWGY